jgi:hypothetical protein
MIKIMNLQTQFKLTELQVLFRQRVFERLQLIAGLTYIIPINTLKMPITYW